MSHTLQRILVPVDGSESANTAIALAIHLAGEHQAEIIFCHAVDYAAIASETAMAGAVDLAGTFAVLDEEAKSVLTAAAKLASAASVRASAYKLEGRSATAIVAYAIERRVDAIVMGTRGLGGLPHLLLGSTAEGVLRAATVPVFVIHADSRITTMGPVFGSIAVAVDDSEPADAAVAFATGLGSRSHSKMTFVTVIDSDALHEQIALYGGYAESIQHEWETEARHLADVAGRHARAAALPASEIVAFGQPEEQLLSQAQNVSADLIAIGTHGRRGLRRLVMGSVAEAVVRKSPVPVVVLRSFAQLRNGHSPSNSETLRAELVPA